MAGLLSSLRRLPANLETMRAIQNMRVLIGGEGGSQLNIKRGMATLTVTRPDLLKALPSGASINVVTGSTPPAVVPPNTIYIQTGGPAVSTMTTHPMFFTGTLVLNQIFGYLNPVAAVNLVTADIFAQTAPTGTDAIFTLVDGAGASLGVTLTLPATQNYVHVAAVLAVAAAGVVRAKITQIGSTIPGGYITIALNYTS